VCPEMFAKNGVVGFAHFAMLFPVRGGNKWLVASCRRGMNATTNLASLVKVNLSTDIIRMKGSSESLMLNDNISGLNI
jgi:hypothetical protein